MWMFLAHDHGDEKARDYVTKLSDLISAEDYEKAKWLALEAYETNYENF